MTDAAPQALASTCAHVADERKAEDIVVLEVGRLAFFTDYFLIATARNERQMRAIRRGLESRVGELGCPVVGVEGEADSGWVLVDLGDVVIHLFTPRSRQLYDLELLWGEAPRLDWRDTEPLSRPVETEKTS